MMRGGFVKGWTSRLSCTCSSSRNQLNDLPANCTNLSRTFSSEASETNGITIRPRPKFFMERKAKLPRQALKPSIRPKFNFVPAKREKFTPQQRDTVVFTAKLSDAVKLDNLEEAEKLFNSMDKRRIAPNRQTLSVMMNGYGKRGEVDKMIDLFQRMENSKMNLDTTAFNTAMQGYSRTGDTEKMMELFQKLLHKDLKPDSFTFNIMMNGFLNNKEPEQVKALFR
jgi:pentatricopeptide repeat protein